LARRGSEGGVQSTRSYRRSSRIVVHDADQPDLVVDLAEADCLSGEDLAEVIFLRLADAATGGLGGGFVMEGVFEVLRAPIDPRGQVIARGRQALSSA
jgi:hypothetical protein